MYEPLAWSLAPHCCRYCLGRVISSATTFRCSDCGVEAVKVTDGRPTAICGCGIRLGEGRLRERRLFRCTPNVAQSEAAPAEIVIEFGDAAEALAPDLNNGWAARRAA